MDVPLPTLGDFQTTLERQANLAVTCLWASASNRYAGKAQPPNAGSFPLTQQEIAVLSLIPTNAKKSDFTLTSKKIPAPRTFTPIGGIISASLDVRLGGFLRSPRMYS